jgi:hypothetical protein
MRSDWTKVAAVRREAGKLFVLFDAADGLAQRMPRERDNAFKTAAEYRLIVCTALRVFAEFDRFQDQPYSRRR